MQGGRIGIERVQQQEGGELHMSFDSKKYELVLDDSIAFYGRVLYRIRALKAFRDVGSSALGGYIESEDNLSQDGDCWVYPGAMVFDHAQVLEDAMIYGSAKVFGYAIVQGSARVYNCAKIYGSAHIGDGAWVSGYVRVCGSVQILGDSRVLIASTSGMICESGQEEEL